MIRIAIVEDDRHDREALKKCLNRYEKENQMKFSVTEFQEDVYKRQLMHLVSPETFSRRENGSAVHST